MPERAWHASVTVAAVLERRGRFLLIEERQDGALVLNQPSGHWEPGETLPAACVRETLEESGFDFVPTAIVGVYRWKSPASDTTYLRFAFCGRVGDRDRARKLDDVIVRGLWLTPEEAFATRDRHRSPLVLRCIEDYLAGRRFPLDLLTHFE